ncbi:hypothetical protein [Bradyrhizobium sp. STM 3562]|uniref:hypothetical protein n=1 Tax=Bradyrhizobium sp. STM 3562 TaxID=578924 RepID=UPI003890E584
MLEVLLTKRGRARWEWRVCDSSGKTIMGASEISRPEAKYQGERALFLLLLTTARTLDPGQVAEGPAPIAARRSRPKRDRDVGDTASRPPGL